MTLVIDNISELITNVPDLGAGPLGVIKPMRRLLLTVMWCWRWAAQEHRPTNDWTQAAVACCLVSWTPTPISCSQATVPRSSPDAWPVNPTTAEGSE